MPWRVRRRVAAALTLDRYGHLMPGQVESVVERLDALARAAEPAPTAAVASIRLTGGA